MVFILYILIYFIYIIYIYISDIYYIILNICHIYTRILYNIDQAYTPVFVLYIPYILAYLI